jgi:hypothetical protein
MNHFQPFSFLNEAFQNQVVLDKNLEWNKSQNTDTQLKGLVNCDKLRNQKVTPDNVDELYACYQQEYNKNVIDMCKKEKMPSYYPNGPDGLLKVSNLTFDGKKADTLNNYTNIIRSINDTIYRQLKEPTSFYESNRKKVDIALNLCTGRKIPMVGIDNTENEQYPVDNNTIDNVKGFEAMILYQADAESLGENKKKLEYSKMYVINKDIIQSIGQYSYNYWNVRQRQSYKKKDLVTVYQGTLRFKQQGYYYFRTFVDNKIKHKFIVSMGGSYHVLFDNNQRVGFIKVTPNNFKEANNGINYVLELIASRGTNINYYYSKNEMSLQQLASVRWKRLTADVPTNENVIPILLSKPIKNVVSLDFVNNNNDKLDFKELNIIKEGGIKINEKNILFSNSLLLNKVLYTSKLINSELTAINEDTNKYDKATILDIFRNRKDYKLVKSSINRNPEYIATNKGVIHLRFKTPISLQSVELWRKSNFIPSKSFFVATTSDGTQFILSLFGEKFFSKYVEVNGKQEIRYGIRFGLYSRRINY